MKNRLKLAAHVIGANLWELQRPYKLTFAATGNCNSRCRSCSIWRSVGQNELDVEEIDRFFGQNPYFSWIDLTGGEVFLRDDFALVVQSVTSNSRYLFHLHIPTNAIDVEKTVAGVVETLECQPELFTLTISLDGDRELHDHVRGVPGNWENCMEAYRRLHPLCSGRFKIFFGFTLSELNLGQFTKTVAAVQERFPGVGVKDFHMNLCHGSQHYYKHRQEVAMFGKNTAKYINDLEQFRRGVKYRLDLIAILENRYLQGAGRFLNNRRSPMACQAISSTIFLNEGGEVFPCSIWDRPLGNIRDHDYDLMAILQSSGSVRDEVKGLQCPNCWTPCEAYPAILASLLSPVRGR